ncbi:hypothetical protein PsYK624_119050 [Phanerochaete sordida]|uniref:Uncharacterized protein n=1 Tax=Phanerochaete sordida TaxID=48140 RepID=A0A9P3GLM2_9APHY|nr:hypothetical protein PsYK624_119050 [Phanerochaete sordida]
MFRTQAVVAVLSMLSAAIFAAEFAAGMPVLNVTLFNISAAAVSELQSDPFAGAPFVPPAVENVRNEDVDSSGRFIDLARAV